MSDIPRTDPTPFTRPPNWFDRLRRLAIARLAQRERARRELARTNFLEYVRVLFPTYDAGWVHVEICAALDAFLTAVEQKQRPRLIINLPPRHGKSELVSRLFPTYILGRHPNYEIVLATGTGDFATKLGRAVRTNFKNPLFSELFPDAQLEGAIQAADNIESTAGGSFFTVGVGGQLTGRGAHILIGDDLVVDQEQADSDGQLDAIWDWYQAVARTRVAAGGGIIIMHTRWSELDPCGRLFELELEDPKADRWQKLIYPAIAVEDEPHRKKGEALHPSRWPLDELESLRRDMSPRMWSSLYQQNPVPLEGVLFKKEWIERTVTAAPANCYHYTLTDLAISEKDHAAYTVIRDMLVDADNNIYYGQLVRRRMGPKDIVEAIIDMAVATNAQYIQLERTQTTMALWPYLLKRMEERGCDVPIWEGTPTKDKVARTTSLRGRMEQGKVFFIESNDHNTYVIPEYLAFPAGKYKDTVDADSWGVLMLNELELPPPPEEEVEEAPHADSYDGMMKRVRSKRSDNPYVPAYVTGEPRKKRAAH